ESRRGVIHAPAALDGARGPARVHDVAADDFYVEACQGGGIGAGADHRAHALAPGDEGAAEVVSDVTVGAGDQSGLHRRLPPWMVRWTNGSYSVPSRRAKARRRI